MCVHVVMHESCPVQGAEDAWDALRCRSLSAKEPLIVGLFCRNSCLTREACAMSCVTRHAHSTRAHTHSLTRRVGLVRVSVWVCESCHSCHVTMHFSDKYIKIFVKFTMSDSQERSIHDLM